MTIINYYLPVRSPVYIIEESPQYILPVPETFPTYKGARPTISVNNLTTLLEPITGLSSSFIIGLLPEADI